MTRLHHLVAMITALLVVVPVSLAATPRPDTPAGETRLVVIKVDGLPQSAVDTYVARTDSRTGRSVLPWIRHLFYDSGVRADNFYSRGISLSEPSWAIIDTGQHAIIKGNFEVDRNTGDSTDHLSFVGFYVESVKSQRLFPPAVEALDATHTPLTSDAWYAEERESGIQLLRRGTRWFELLKVGVDPARRATLSQRVGDLLVGVNMIEVWAKISEERFLKAVLDPRIRYADFYWPYIDEAIHDDNSDASLRLALSKFDRMLGRTQQAIAQSGTADRTVLVVVSDHGATYDVEGRYSQGINLIGYLDRPEFGAHHTMSRGGPLGNYELKGSAFSPFASSASLTTSKHSAYLSDRPEQITCALDYDGNERAQLHLRDPDLTRLQMLWRTIRFGRLDVSRSALAGRGALAILERRRAGWAREAAELTEEVGALSRQLLALRAEQRRIDSATAKFAPSGKAMPNATPANLAPFEGVSVLNHRDPRSDLVQRSKEIVAELYRTERLRIEYGAVRDRIALRARISTAEAFAAVSESSLFGLREFGKPLDAADLMAYPVRLRELVMSPGGELDERASFDTVNYLDAFSAIRIRNSASSARGTAPVSWAIAELDVSAAMSALERAGGGVHSASRAFLVHGDASRQLLMTYRTSDDGRLLVTLHPIARFALRPPSGDYEFELATWRPGLPFGLYEDAKLETDDIDRAVWLSTEHDLSAWRDSTHRTAEGLAVVGFTEVVSTDYRRHLDARIASATQPDERLLLRFERRRRDAVATDLFLHATPHWNFDLKDFNAGGNHGGFARESMRGVFWMRGGTHTRMQAGPLVIERPYDGLDVAPTLLEAGGLTTSGILSEELRRGGFRDFPGAIVREAFRPR